MHLIVLARTLRIFPLGRLRAALARLEAASGQPFDTGEKAVIAERSADALGGAQARDLFGVVI